MMVGMRRLTAVIVAIGIVATATPMGRAEGSPATASGSTGRALVQSSVARIADSAPLTPAVVSEVAPSEGIELAARPLEARSRDAPGRSVDLAALKRDLRETSAIGLLTKLKLNRDLRRLVEDFGRYHRGDASITSEKLGERFDRLLRRVVRLLRDDDPALAARIAAARGALWSLLADPDGEQRQAIRL